MKNNILFRRLYGILVTALLLAGCSEGPAGSGDGGGDNDDGQLYEKKNMTIMGIVSCDGSGVANVAVSDGTNVTKTDAYGRYWLQSDISHHEFNFVHISIPSGYETVEQKGVAPAYWTTIDKEAEGVQRIDFALREVDQSNYTLLAIADSHVLGGHGRFQSKSDRTQYNEVFMPKWKSYAEQCRAQGPVYGVHMGDMTQSEAWGKYTIAHFRDDTTCEVPLFCAMGNHDHDTPGSAKMTTFADETQYLSRKSYTAAMGPAYYSFNIGTEHYVVLDNTFIRTNNSGDYLCQLDSRQLAWLRKDVAAINKNVIKGIVVVQHIQMFNDKGNVAMKNGDRVMDIFKNYPVTFLIGHSHMDRSLKSQTPAGKPVWEFVHPSLAGTAWFTLSNRDGTPAAFCAYNFKDGVGVKRTYVPFGENEKLKYRIYSSAASVGISAAWNYPVTEKTGKYESIERDNEFASSTDRSAMLLNWWGAARVEFTGDGVVSLPGIYDLTYRDWYWPALEAGNVGKYADGEGASWQKPSKNATHIWQYIPKASGSAAVVVEGYDAYENSLGRFMVTVK